MQRSLVASWLTTFVASVAATMALTTSVPACQTACVDAFDCGANEYCDDATDTCLSQCVIDSDCPPRTCDDDQDPRCRPTGARCGALGRCRYYDALDGRGPVIDVADGFDAQVGTGEVFVVNHLAVAARGDGFDLDDKCGSDGCLDNALAPLGPLGNQQIKQGVLGGESLLLMELAGLETSFTGNELSLTVKFYAGVDADSPPVASDNFTYPPGATVCCQFNVKSSALSSTGQALSRMPATMSRGQLSSLAPASLSFTVAIGDAPYPELKVERAQISGKIPVGLGSIDLGTLGGAVPAGSLARIANPYCKTDSMLCARTLETSSMLDLVGSFFQPDIDLDDPPDGLDRLTAGATGVIDDCRDARGTPIPPLDPLRLESCGENPELRDGFSVAFDFTAVSASILGSE